MTLARSGFTQDGAFLSVRTALGTDALLLDVFQGSEGLSRLFAYTLTLRSTSNTLSAADVIGTSATVKMQFPGASERYFNGIVSRFTYLGSAADFALYTLDLVPRMWLLTLGRDRVIYQNLSAPDIIKKVLGDFGVVFDAKLTGSYVTREYCVRYDETAFDFVSRLMEEEGIFYFFSYADGAHTLVLADSISAYAPCANAATLTMDSGGQGRRRVDTATRFETESRLVAKSHAVSDYNYLTPSTTLLAQNDGSDGRGLDFEYPGRYQVVADGTARARIRVEEHHAESLVSRGESYCHHLLPGGTFTLAGHSRADLNSSHVLRSVHHHAEKESYGNSFETLPSSVSFRAPRLTPRPIVAGSHTAKVVGPAGEEIWTDKHGRVKVQFPWDRVGANDDKSSCWIRVSQIWAGEGWGALFLPRIGQEVVVSYVDGDPDRPLVSGSVYNGTKTPPVGLPANSTQSTILSRSSKNGTAGNEMRMEDKEGSEEFYLHAQKDMRVEVENDLATTVIAGNETHTVTKGDRTVKVDTGKEVHSVKGTRALEITGNETHDNKADFTQTVTGNYELKVTGNLTIDVTGTILLKSAKTVDVQAGTALTNKAGTALTNKAGTDLQNDAGVGLTNKGGATVSNEAPSITSKASGMQTVEAGGILTLKGALVKVN